MYLVRIDARGYTVIHLYTAGYRGIEKSYTTCIITLISLMSGLEVRLRRSTRRERVKIIGCLAWEQHRLGADN